jgi:TolB-like protein
MAAGVIAIVVVGAAYAWRQWTHSIEERTLAVLPFENAAKDPDFEYLCEGIAGSLIKRVSKLPSLNVRPLATVLNFKGRLDDPAAAGRELGVASILVGSLALDGTRLKISARLIDVATGRELWTNSYDRDAGELLNVQDEIATAIMDEGLRIRLSDDEREQIVRHPTTSGEAYDLYLQAEYAQRGATEDGYLESRRLLELAVTHDQQFALAYAALGGNYAMMVTDGYERPTEAWPQISRYYRKAYDVDPSQAGAPTYEHAYAFLFDWDWDAAAKARERAMQIPIAEIEPDGLRALAIELWALGKPDEAVQLARRMRLLEPTAGYLASLEADLLVRTGQYEDAVALYTHAMRFEPENPNLYFGLAEARYRQKRFDEALQIRRKAHAMAGDDRLEPVFAAARGEQGYRDVDRAWVVLQLDALKERERTRYVSPLDFARAYAQLGDKEQAFRHLDASFEHRSPGLVFLKVDTAWDNVRSDPRFAAAIKRIGLP